MASGYSPSPLVTAGIAPNSPGTESARSWRVGLARAPPLQRVPSTKSVGALLVSNLRGLSPGQLWVTFFMLMAVVAVASGGIGYEVARSRGGDAGNAGAGGGGNLAAVTLSSSNTGSNTGSNSPTNTASHTNGASPSNTATGTPSSSVSGTATASPTMLATRSQLPSATSMTGVVEAAERLMVKGDRMAFLAFGDWGRCHTPNAAEVVRRSTSANCNNQRSMANAMDEWAQAAKVRIILSTGDNFYEGPLQDLDQRYQYSW